MAATQVFGMKHGFADIAPARATMIQTFSRNVAGKSRPRRKQRRL
jgi:hypothetical protein